MRLLPLLSLPLLLTACGPTLTLGPTGWQEKQTQYSVTPLSDRKLFTGDWTLKNYEEVSGGFRNLAPTDRPYFSFHRRADDGVMVVQSEYLEHDDREKLAEALADRSIARVVVNPKRDDDWCSNFADVLPALEVGAQAQVGFRTISSTTLLGRDVQEQSRALFDVDGGKAVELSAQLGPRGSAPDRGVYLAVAKPNGGDYFVIVAYGNTISQFDKGLADARSFAHRIHF